jgi:glycosyltransferase involved in cell wall biosynthesis
MFAYRLLKGKGVKEFVEAARTLKARCVAARFWLAGSPDPGNLTSICEDDVLQWNQDGLIEVLGYQ